ncbi:MAG TPA: DUF3291 domain-containing protein [Acidimicrobiales bacterium]
MAGHHLAQVNVGRLRAPKGSPMVEEFFANLDPINALADAAPGFVWRLQTEEGNATDIQVDDGDPLFIVNLSVWESVDALKAFVHRTDHRDFLRRRREWFEVLDEAIMALWWVPAGTTPTVDEAMERLATLRREGPGPAAFTFREVHAPPAPAGRSAGHQRA